MLQKSIANSVIEKPGKNKLSWQTGGRDRKGNVTA